MNAPEANVAPANATAAALLSVAEFMRQPEPPPPAPDKKAIKDAIEKEGREVAGCHLEFGHRLEIK